MPSKPPSCSPFTTVLVHGFSTASLAAARRSGLLIFTAPISANHLEAGVGTGFFLDRTGTAKFGRLALADINRPCLDRAGRRLARFKPELYQVNLLAPIRLDVAPFATVGLTYLLHCLPSRMSEKLTAVDHLRLAMGKGAVLFGATIYEQRVQQSRGRYGVLVPRPRQRFDKVEIAGGLRRPILHDLTGAAPPGALGWSLTRRLPCQVSPRFIVNPR